MPQRSRYLGRGQIAVCMRSGIKCKASELVRDGRIPSLLVLPEWADPPQPQERPYVPDDMEGSPRFPVSPDTVSAASLVPPVLSAEGELDGSITLSWTAAEWLAGPRTDTYRLLRSEDGADFVLIETVTVEYDIFGGITGPALTFNDTDVVPGESYRYKVTAIADGASQVSNTATIVAPEDPIPPENEVDLFLFVGTSNMRSLASTTPPAYLSGPMAGAEIWNTTTEEFETYEATVNSDTFNSTNAWGPEAEFARQYLADNPTETIYMVKIGVNNSLLATPSASPTWNPSGGDLFDDMTAAVVAAKAALVGQGFSPVVRAIIVDMGWNDAKLVGDAAAFPTNLEDFLTEARLQWATAATPVFLNRIQEAGTLPFSGDVRVDQVTVAESMVGVTWFDTDAYPASTTLGPSPHYLNQSIEAFGYDAYHSYAGDYPALSELPNPTFSNVSLLAGFDGLDGATTYTEESSAARVATFSGNAQLDTAVGSVFYGTASALFDGTGDSITFPDSPAFHMGSGPFVIEFTFKPNALVGNISAFVNQWNSGAGQRSFTFDLTPSNSLRFSYSVDGAVTVTPLSVEYYPSVYKADRIMIERDASNDLRIFQNGILLGKVNLGTVSFFNSTEALRIGDLTGFAFGVNGIIDELRITKGQSLHGSDARFLPRTTMFPRS